MGKEGIAQNGQKALNAFPIDFAYDALQRQYAQQC